MSQPGISPRRPLEPEPKAIVVGASSGIGAALLKQLTASGYRVAALARREEELAAACAEANRLSGATRAHAYPHDVTSFDDVPLLFQQIVRDLEGPDLIVYAAAVQPPVEPGEYDFEKDRRMIEVNLLGAIAWLNQAAQRFAQVRAGHIVGISSISGDRGRSAFPGYHASKGGLSIYLESLRNRLSQKGVVVTTIKPGLVDTRLLENATMTLWVISPDEAARQIYEAIREKKQTVYVPGRWRWVSLAISNIPSVLFRRLNL